MAGVLSGSILQKLQEQVDRIDHLVSLIPPERTHWAPPLEGAWTTSQVVEHLPECLKGFCAALLAIEPDRLAYLTELKDATHSIEELMETISRAFDVVDDDALSRIVPTIFSPQGEPLISVLLGNLEHLINHKHQLFFYLKLMGVAVESSDLYRFR